MAVKRFSWSNFEYDFIKAVIYGKHTPKRQQPSYEIKDIDGLIPYMDDICSYPNEKFVRNYREEIQEYFLKGSNHLIRMISRLEKLNYGGLKVGSNDEMLYALRQKRMTQILLDCFVRELRFAGKQVEDCEDSLFSMPRSIDLTVTSGGKIGLYPYQENAVKVLKKYFLSDQHGSGVLSMPTGSGKTRTSVYFLLREMVSRGYQVLWLAHRSMLLDQAAEQFYQFAPLIKEENQELEEFKMVCISGKHASIHAMEKNDNLIIASVQSLCNKTNYLPNILGDKIIMVVDEAHHTLAPSYRRIIKAVREQRPDSKLLGLTATPVRLKDIDTKALMHIYEDKPIYSVAMSDLIAEKILSTPVHIPIETNVDIRTMINIDEEKYIKKWGEMPETLVTKVAKTNKRNECIVNEYVKNKEKYGKTIIFALNAIHCDTLNEMFRARGIRSDYVYSVNGSAENQKVIERFRNSDREDGIDVLININILTEGSDIPDIQTVFLTRPTSSDVLLMQMVGRGMRGTGCGGTENVNIVDFCDKWSSITRWMSPKFILGEQSEIEDKKYKRTVRGSLVPMQMVRDIVSGISYSNVRVKIKDTCFPVGWYDVNDVDGNDTKILVYENQLNGYKELKKDYQFFMNNERLGVSDIYKAYFRDFGMQPMENDLENLLFYIRNEKVYPEFFEFRIRDAIDPCAVAKKIKELDLPFSKMEPYIKEVFEINKSIILDLYDSYEYYQRRVTDFLLYSDGKVPLGVKIEEVEKKVYKFSRVGQKKTIDRLLEEVMEEQQHNLPEDFVRPQIYWTNRDYASYFGKYVPNRNEIYVNNLLNSISVPEEVVKYIIYHECLHQKIHGHTDEFREKEHRYPNFQELDHFLDYKLSDFELDEED